MMLGTDSLISMVFLLSVRVNDTGIARDFLGFIVPKSPENVRKIATVI